MKAKLENPMRKIRIEKVVLSAGATGDDLLKEKKLLKMVSGMEPQIITTNKRIPDFNVRPGLEVGTRVTLRGESALDVLKRILGSVDNILSEKSISDNHFSLGIKEYIDIPGMEYQRDIGIRGFNVTVVFVRPGVRVQRKKVKAGKLSKKQVVSAEEIINYMKEAFKTKFT